jgi:hypothetical protein
MAERYFESGKEALAAGDDEYACDLFKASVYCHPQASPMVKVARCHRDEGKLELASHAYDAALRLNRADPAPWNERRQKLEEVSVHELGAVKSSLMHEELDRQRDHGVRRPSSRSLPTAKRP